MIYYHNHPEYRIGDEIQTTALIKYLKTKGDEIYYKDSNPFVSAIELFPDDLVVFSSENFFNYKIFEPGDIWFWSVMLKEKGIYTELNHQYKESEVEFDVVFSPVLCPTYNSIRAIKPESALSMLKILADQYNEVRMIVDKNKKHLFKEIENSNIIYSDNIYETFEYIKHSKIFLGTDTGTTHYAGALKHPRMVLAFPDETPIQNKVRWHRNIIAKQCNEPDILNIEVSTLPCCDPKQFKVVQIENNEMPINKVMQKMDHF